MFWKKPSIKQLLPPPVRVAHGEYSMILAAHDDPSRATPELVQLSLRAIAEASQLTELHPSPYVAIWPGEHYKLLAGFIKTLQPKLVVEIGTATGLSALCMKRFLPKGARLVTFDVVPWHKVPRTVLTSKDFESGLLTQFVEDLGDPYVVRKHTAMLQDATLIFIDATHDGVLEAKLLATLQAIPFRQKAYAILDDIRVWTMLKMWREVRLPKLDLTSFGHWSGTGLVELN